MTLSWTPLNELQNRGGRWDRTELHAHMIDNRAARSCRRTSATRPSPLQLPDNYPWDVRQVATFTIMHNIILITARSPAGGSEVRARAQETTLLHPAGPSPKWVRNALWLVLKRDNSHLSIVPSTIEGTSRIVHNLDGTISLGRGPRGVISIDRGWKVNRVRRSLKSATRRDVARWRIGLKSLLRYYRVSVGQPVCMSGPWKRIAMITKCLLVPMGHVECEQSRFFFFR